jgi:(4-O-methyl)-D-glucuronate---lignin esterase
MIRRLLGSAFAIAAGAAVLAQPSPERRAATEADYRATLARLGIASVRPGADGFNRSAPNAANYDEAKAGMTSPLPALLRTRDGRPVTSAAMWWRVRRPELVALFDREVYGRVPATAPRIAWIRASTERREKAGTPVVTDHFQGRAGDGKVAIQLDVTLPAAARGRVPVVMELGFPEGFHFPGFNPPPKTGPDWMEQVIARGWGFAILVPSTIQPDDGAGLKEGVIGLASAGRPRAPDEWGALRAWAWGASRALDRLRADRRVDARRVAIEGLSRYGKAALVTMAYDRRFSIGFIGSSGAGGAKLLRRDFGERVENLAASGEYHWFAPNFIRYAGPLRTADLPVDAHELIALAAPRPLFIGAGTIAAGDGWVDPRGSFEAARAASPAWRLLGVQGLAGDTFPPIGEARASGRLAFREHEGGHTNGPNWPAFLVFAARMWGINR